MLELSCLDPTSLCYSVNIQISTRSTGTYCHFSPMADMDSPAKNKLGIYLN